MKLSKLKVFQSVKVGSKENTFLTDTDFDMELKDTLVFITRKSDGTKVVTPLTNTPWFVVSEEGIADLNKITQAALNPSTKPKASKKPSKARKPKGGA